MRFPSLYALVALLVLYPASGWPRIHPLLSCCILRSSLVPGRCVQPRPPALPAAVLKNIALSWGVTLPVSAAISVVFYLLCQPLVPPVAVAAVASRLAALPMVG